MRKSIDRLRKVKCGGATSSEDAVDANPPVYLEDHIGGDVTEFGVSREQAILRVTHDFKAFYTVRILNRDGSELFWSSTWMDFRMVAEADGGNLSLGQLEKAEVKDGKVYLDCDFGSFCFVADQTIPGSKHQKCDEK